MWWFRAPVVRGSKIINPVILHRHDANQSQLLLNSKLRSKNKIPSTPKKEFLRSFNSFQPGFKDLWRNALKKQKKMAQH